MDQTSNDNYNRRKTAMDVIKFRKENPSNRKDLLGAMLEGVDPRTRQKMTDKSITDNLSQFHFLSWYTNKEEKN